MAEENQKDEVIPLEGLAPQASEANAETNPAVGVVDAVLSVEDPQFASSMQELKEQVAQADLAAAAASNEAIVPIDLNALPPPPATGLKGRLQDVLAAVKAAIPKIKGAIASTLASFKALSTTSKLLLVGAIFLGLLSLFALKLAFNTKFLPNLQPPFLNSFGDVADASFEYDPREKMQDFADPLTHPEYVVLINKLVVNLKPPGDGTNPMGLFEFYFDASNDACAVEIKDREVEVRDLVSRTLEAMSYRELVTPDGKEKLKLVLRRNLNALLTKGQVRRVFIKTIVLKD